MVSEGLGALHLIVREHLGRAEIEAKNKEVDRLKDREVAQERLTRSAMDGVAAILNPRDTIPYRETPLLTAANLVGDALGVEIHPPAKSEDPGRVKDPLDAIARASKIATGGSCCVASGGTMTADHWSGTWRTDTGR